ncbi:anchored repeat ABC transporter, substrate-binding protein [Streptomyces polyrhachis]|uniref:Anchored repeat ABC transporter, substrate-binding protein n=1 Tax=Streptomyces polyrhachis TaxID=1282885 RepID=A0ABW2GFK3_9ACTN
MPTPIRTTAALCAAALLTGCGGDTGAGEAGLRVSTTTGILADLVRQVAGERAEVTAIVPHHGDPHSYEPSPGDTAEVARADLVFSNGLLLEEPGIMKMIHSNARKGTPKIAVSEKLEEFGGTVIKLQEDLGLDVLWLGWAVEGAVPGEGSQIRITARELSGPGDLHVYLTDTLGTPHSYLDSTDGLDAADSFTLPPEAHTHVNWVFTEPGTYELTVTGESETLAGKRREVARGTVTFAVGGRGDQGGRGRELLATGHADIALDAEKGEVFVRAEEAATGESVRHPPGSVALSVPDKARKTVPKEEAYRFLGDAGADIWVLPQAVLGKHVHGETDPHAWEDVANAEAYIRRITAELTRADPQGRAVYEKNAAAYLATLHALDAEVARTLATIPQGHRKLITTHDAFGYLAKAYGMEVAGFVVPVPNQEPSAAEVEHLGRTIRETGVPAVFLEPNLAARADVLRRVAQDEGVRVCTVYGDSFDEKVHDYVAMMRHNANELARCLGGEGS